jgi:hypothetical protein
LLIGFAAGIQKLETITQIRKTFLRESFFHYNIIFSSQFRYPLFHGRIPMILNRVISPPVQHLSNLSPLVADSPMIQIQNPLLLLAPCDFLNLRIQVIMPPFSALLADSSRQMLCDLRPFLRAMGLY